jgi:hypothetical protein
VDTAIFIGLVSVAATALVSVIPTLRKYIAARGKADVRLTIDGDTLHINKVTTEQAEQLINTWLTERDITKIKREGDSE